MRTERGSADAYVPERRLGGERLSERMSGREPLGDELAFPARAEAARHRLRGGVCRMGDDKRFSFPSEPEFGMDAGLVERSPQMPQLAATQAVRRVRGERTQKCDLRRVPAGRAHVGEHADDLLPRGVERRPVAHVEHDDVNTSVTQHLRMLAQNERIVRAVIAEKRFAPPVVAVHRTPERRVRFLQGVWIRRQDLRYVERSRHVFVGGTVDEVEHRDRTVCPGQTGLRRRGERTAKPVRRHPRVGCDVAWRGQSRQHNRRRENHADFHMALLRCQACSITARTDCFMPLAFQERRVFDGLGFMFGMGMY